jgi:hypothetical protein
MEDGEKFTYLPPSLQKIFKNMPRPFKEIPPILGIDKDRPALDTVDANKVKSPRGSNEEFFGYGCFLCGH